LDLKSIDQSIYLPRLFCTSLLVSLQFLLGLISLSFPELKYSNQVSRWIRNRMIIDRVKSGT
jgi:hypothetical protein